MNMLNSVIIEGKFNHFTSKKGTLPLTFLVDNVSSSGKQSFAISVKSSAMAENFLKHNASGLRIVGKLERIGSKNTVVVAEHIEFKKSEVQK